MCVWEEGIEKSKVVFAQSHRSCLCSHSVHFSLFVNHSSSLSSKDPNSYENLVDLKAALGESKTTEREIFK